jgi:hypothetical protein
VVKSAAFRCIFDLYGVVKSTEKSVHFADFAKWIFEKCALFKSKMRSWTFCQTDFEKCALFKSEMRRNFFLVAHFCSQIRAKQALRDTSGCEAYNYRTIV